MNQASKLGRKSSEGAPSKKKADPKKKPSTRSPLRNLNNAAATSFPPPPDAPRGCFRFLLSNPSSKDSLLRSKSNPRTPRSAPPNPRTLISKKPAKNSKSQKKPLKSSSENLKQLGSKASLEPRGSDLAHWRNYRKTSSEVPPADRNRTTELSFDVNLEKNGGNLASTPEKMLLRFNPEIGFKRNGAHLDHKLAITPEKGGELGLSGTPASAATPPVQASISPELSGGPAVAPTPACFAAGHHVVSGVQDRRKCRPRGILTIGGAGLEVEKDMGDGLRTSLVLPPIEEASIQWLSSPSEILNVNTTTSFSSGSRARGCTGEASVNWLLSPSKNGKESVVRNAFKGELQQTSVSRRKLSSECELWKLSPTDFNPTASAELGGIAGISSFVSERTPSSGIDIFRTPTTGSSISPYSMILRRAAANSQCKVFQTHEKGGRYCYGSDVENSPHYGDLWGSGNILVTPTSASSLGKEEGLPPLELDSMVEVLGTMSMSPQPRMKHGNASDLLPLPGLSFQFGCPATPSNSIDFGHFPKPLHKKAVQKDGFDLKGKNWLDSGVRISWREGLESRIFEMGDLDCCQWLSDDEDPIDHHGEHKVECKFDVKLDRNNQSSMSKEGKDQHITEGFGSIEFTHDDVCVKEKGPKISPAEIISCAESISTEGGGLISSSDSDWTVFYRNHLFETRCPFVFT